MASSRFFDLAVGILAVWRLTHLFYGEDGPWNVMVRLRRLAGAGFWGHLLDCFYCLSLWFAALFAYFLAGPWRQRLLLWPALSGGAILLERITSHERRTPPAAYVEDSLEEGKDVLRES